jgi:hypothetical protein
MPPVFYTDTPTPSRYCATLPKESDDDSRMLLDGLQSVAHWLLIAVWHIARNATGPSNFADLMERQAVGSVMFEAQPRVLLAPRMCDRPTQRVAVLDEFSSEAAPKSG